MSAARASVRIRLNMATSEILVADEMPAGRCGFVRASLPPSTALYRPPRPRPRINLPNPLENHPPPLDPAEMLPVVLQRGCIEPQRRVATRSGRRRHQRGEPVIHRRAQRRVYPRDQVPQRHRVLPAGQAQHRANGCRAAAFEIECRERLAQRGRRVLHERRARSPPPPPPGARHPQSPQGHDRATPPPWDPDAAGRARQTPPPPPPPPPGRGAP